MITTISFDDMISKLTPNSVLIFPYLYNFITNPSKELLMELDNKNLEYYILNCNNYYECTDGYIYEYKLCRNIDITSNVPYDKYLPYLDYKELNLYDFVDKIFDVISFLPQSNKSKLLDKDEFKNILDSKIPFGFYFQLKINGTSLDYYKALIIRYDDGGNIQLYDKNSYLSYSVIGLDEYMENITLSTFETQQLEIYNILTLT